MKWLIITCDATNHIKPVQKWLFDKYFGNIEIVYLDLGSEPVSTWADNVYRKIAEFKDDYVIFGLDDYLPIHFPTPYGFNDAVNVIKKFDLDRFELGLGASKKKGMEDDMYFIMHDDVDGVKIPFKRYGKDTPYSVSCQFSIWNLQRLKDLLKEHPNWSPWDFEVKGKLDNVGCFSSDKSVFRWIEESAISGRQKGKVNVLGLKPNDVDELVNIGLLDRSKLIYGWKGATKYTDELGGNKYKEFYV